MEPKYTIERAPSFEELEERVNEYILDGWQPLGGISYAGGEVGLYCQALIRTN